jgi:hypothetical protein
MVARAVQRQSDSPVQDATPHGRHAAFSLPRLRGAAAINAVLALLMVLDGVAESLIYGDWSLLVFSAGFAALFAFYGRRLSQPEADRRRWLRTSGWSCAALAGLCVISAVGAVVSSPVDVACVFIASGFFAAFTTASIHQLKLPS